MKPSNSYSPPNTSRMEPSAPPKRERADEGTAADRLPAAVTSVQKEKPLFSVAPASMAAKAPAALEAVKGATVTPDRS